MNRKQQPLTAAVSDRLTLVCDKQQPKDLKSMTQLPLPDAMSLLQAGAALCLIALIARRRQMRRSDWEGAAAKLSGRVSPED
jgi:hypothetical protein